MKNNAQTVYLSASLLNNYKDGSSIAGYLMAQLSQANSDLTKAAIFLDEELLPQAYANLIDNRRCGSSTLYKNIETMSPEQKRIAFFYTSPKDDDIGIKSSIDLQEIYLYSSSYQTILNSLKSLTPESPIMISMADTVANLPYEVDMLKQMQYRVNDQNHSIKMKMLWVTKIAEENSITKSFTQQLQA